MRLAETGAAIDVQRVIERAGILRRAERRTVREAVRRAHDEMVEGVAVELGHVVLRRALLLIVDQLFLAHDDLQLERAGEELVERLLDEIAVARFDDIPLHGGGRVQHQLVFTEINGGAVGKPGVVCRLGQVLGEHAEYHFPYLIG